MGFAHQDNGGLAHQETPAAGGSDPVTEPLWWQDFSELAAHDFMPGGDGTSVTGEGGVTIYTEGDTGATTFELDGDDLVIEPSGANDEHTGPSPRVYVMVDDIDDSPSNDALYVAMLVSSLGSPLSGNWEGYWVEMAEDGFTTAWEAVLAGVYATGATVNARSRRGTGGLSDLAFSTYLPGLSATVTTISLAYQGDTFTSRYSNSDESANGAFAGTKGHSHCVSNNSAVERQAIDMTASTAKIGFGARGKAAGNRPLPFSAFGVFRIG